MAERTSLVGITPYLSPSIGSANRLKASRISLSSCAVTLCSFASFDSRGFGASAGDLRFGGCDCALVPGSADRLGSRRTRLTQRARGTHHVVGRGVRCGRRLRIEGFEACGGELIEMFRDRVGWIPVLEHGQRFCYWSICAHKSVKTRTKRDSRLELNYLGGNG